MHFFPYFILVSVIVGVSLLGMSIGLIFRNKPFTSCGRASAKFNGEAMGCSVCSGKGDGASCERQKESHAEDLSAS